ncbi:ARM repeat-containing protein [Schizophyllum commune Tattone D]|nr:ARM repeat-containing protein [Schizophyllum commune Tattone D]
MLASLFASTTTCPLNRSAAHTGEHRRMTAHADTSVSGSQPISHGPAQGEFALSLMAPDGSGVWALTICPARSFGSTSSPPWTFRLHDPQGTAHELVVGKCDDSVLLHRAPNPWRPFSLRRRYAADGDHDAVDDEDEWREVVRRKVTALLNKLTAGNLDTISKQIIEWANESENEEDARTVKLVVQLVLDAARDVPHLSGMYARLCYRITSRPVGSRVKGDIPIDVHRTPPSGRALFSNLLFDLIKKEFGIMPFSAEQCQTTVTSKVAAAHDGIDRRHGVGVPSRQRKATRRGYGLAVFVATLVKLGEYAEDVLLMLVQELLDTIISHKDSQDIECLCTLLSIAGDRLETRSSKESLNRHLSRMKKLSKSRRVRPRERFMLEDVIERREWGWIPPLPLTPRSDMATIADCSDEDSAEDLPEPSRSYQFARRRQSRLVHGQNPVLPESVPSVPARASGRPPTQARDADGIRPSLSSFTLRPSVTSKGQKPSSQSQMNPMVIPRMPPAQSLPGGPAPGMQAGMPPAPMRGCFYPPPYGGYVDPNWAAAYGQWYMPHQGPNGVASPPGTPASAATVPVPGGRLNQSAAPLTPSSPARKITLRAPDGSELKFDKFKQNGQQPAASPATPTVTGSRRSVKIEKRTRSGSPPRRQCLQ